jgi:hypothetical protein
MEATPTTFHRFLVSRTQQLDHTSLLYDRLSMAISHLLGQGTDFRAAA